MDTPPPILPREITYEWTPEIAKAAARRIVFGNSNAITTALVLIVLSGFLGYLVTGGNMIGVRGFLICSSIFYLIILVSSRLRTQRTQNELPDGLRTLTIAEEGLTIRSSGLTITAKWQRFKEVRNFPDFVLLYLRDSPICVAAPAAHLGEDLRRVIENKVRLQGGKVTALETKGARATRRLRRGVVLTAALSLILAAVCFHPKPTMTGDGVIKVEKRTVSDFTKLRITGDYDVQWSPGSPAVSIAADENILPFILTGSTGHFLETDSTTHLSWPYSFDSTASTGHILEISSTRTLHPTKAITIIVSSPSLNELDLTGDARVKAVNISGRKFRIVCAGDPEITVQGSVRDLDVNLASDGSLDAKQLQTASAEVSITGGASADIAVSHNLKATLTGTGHLTYTGNPASVAKLITGSGVVIRAQ